jgi:hypothetical protein
MLKPSTNYFVVNHPQCPRQNPQASENLRKKTLDRVSEKGLKIK